MASVELGELYLHDATDLSDYIHSDGFGGLDEEDAVDGEFRQYSAGRVRLIRRAGEPREVNVTLPAVSASDVEWLRVHKGRTLLLRDPRGRKMYGTFLRLSIPERHGPLRPHVSFRFVRITHTESVA